MDNIPHDQCNDFWWFNGWDRSTKKNNKLFTKQDPKELFIAINEFVFNISDKVKKTSDSSDNSGKETSSKVKKSIKSSKATKTVQKEKRENS